MPGAVIGNEEAYAGKVIIRLRIFLSDERDKKENDLDKGGAEADGNIEETERSKETEEPEDSESQKRDRRIQKVQKSRNIQKFSRKQRLPEIRMAPKKYFHSGKSGICRRTLHAEKSF